LPVTPRRATGGQSSFGCWLASAACVLMESLRRIALRDTEAAHAQVNNHPLKLLRIGAQVLGNTRRIRLLLPSSYPYKKPSTQAALRLDSG